MDKWYHHRKQTRIRIAGKCLASVVALMGCYQATAQSVERSGVATLVHLDGLDIEFANDGQWNKIFSTYVQPVEFPDRRGIKTAQIIAEEKGKAAIIRFINQEVSSNRLVEEVESTVSKANMTKGAGSKDGTVKTNERTMIESVKEFTRSFSSGSLRGVTVLEAGYDEKKEEAWVKVGLSRATMGIAQHLGGAMRGEPQGAAQPGAGSQGVTPQPSEVRARELP